MSRRSLLILLIVGGAVLIAALLYFIVRAGTGTRVIANSNANTNGTSQANINQANVNAVTTAPQPVAPPPPAPTTSLQDQLVRLGILFSERFGSFSSQGQFTNFTDLYPLMTDGMKTWATNYLDQLKKNYTPDTYQGISTLALNTKFVTFDETGGKAEITVLTQRHESTQTTDTVYYQPMKIDFTKDGDLWKVSGAFWQPKQ